MFEMSVPTTGKSGNETRATALEQEYEKRPDPVALTQNPDPSKNSTTGVDYEPYPEQSIQLAPAQEKILQSICNLYSGSASKEDMMVYADEAIYDDPWSYCDTRYKIAGQWYGKWLHKKTYCTAVRMFTNRLRDSQDHEVDEDHQDASGIIKTGRDRLQVAARIHAKAFACS